MAKTITRVPRAAAKRIHALHKDFESAQRQLGALRYRQMAEESAVASVVTARSRQYEAAVADAAKALALDIVNDAYDFDVAAMTFKRTRRGKRPTKKSAKTPRK